MAKRNFFISYCKDGAEYARQITQLLQKSGYTVWDASKDLGEVPFAKAIVEAIRNCDYFMPIITDGYNTSLYALNELDLAINSSISRAKEIVPVVLTNSISMTLKYYISRLQWIRVDQHDMQGVVEQIDQRFSYKLKSAVLYEKLVEFKTIKNEDKVAVTLCQLINLLTQQFLQSNNLSLKDKCDLSKEICRLFAELEHYQGRYDQESADIARIILDTLEIAESLFNTSTSQTREKELFLRDMYFCSVAIRLLFHSYEIYKECADILSNGNVQGVTYIEDYIQKQAPFVQVYLSVPEESYQDFGFSGEDTAFVQQTKHYILANRPIDERLTNSHKKRDVSADSESDDILLSIAKFMQDGNKLFDVLQSRGMAGDFLECLLTSYERLKNYCEVVGAKHVAADCVERIVEIRNIIQRAPQSSSSDEKAENGIKSLLGLTLKGSGNYDVFISFKNEDSDLAEIIYNFAQKNLKVPFWSKRTLPQLSKSEFEDAIYEAIRKSKHFIVVLSNLEYLNANWIKREMSAFDRAITEGRKKDANFVFVVTDDVYKQIIDCNKMCLDERYCGYQIIKMSEYEATLISYLS